VSPLASNGLNWRGSEFGDEVGKYMDSFGRWFAGVKFGRVEDLVKLEIAWEAKLKGSRVNHPYDLKGANKSSR
jgi:hypothetical protein